MKSLLACCVGLLLAPSSSSSVADKCSVSVSIAGAESAAPVASLTAAFDALRAARASADLVGESTISIYGVCAPPRPLTAADSGTAAAPVRVSGAGPDGAAPATISGGVSVPASWLVPVTDPAVLEQIPAAARANVQALDLAAHGLAPSMGALACHPYMGGEASILPGNLVGAGMEMFAPASSLGGDNGPLTLARYPNRDVSPAGWSSGSVDGYVITPDAATAARLPGWARQLREDPGSIYAHYLGGYRWNDHINAVANISVAGDAGGGGQPCAGTGAAGGGAALNCSMFELGFDYDGNDLEPPHHEDSQAGCCAACNAFPGCSAYSWCTTPAACGATNCYLKNSTAGRKPWPNRASGPHAPTPPASTLTLGACPSHYAQPGFDTLDDAGTFYVQNVLAELDTPGEYYINRTAQMLYVWLPAADDASYWGVSPWGAPVAAPQTVRAIEAAHRAQLAAAADPAVAVLSVNDTVLSLSGASFVTYDSVVVAYAQGAGVVLVNASNVTFSNALLQNFGNMALNVTGGGALAVRDAVVRGAGSGAVFLYAGDRASLTPSGHALHNVSLSYSNRHMYCYVPMVAMADCGNAVRDCELFGGPHQGVFISGNEHALEGSYLHDLVQAAADSGAVYMGRDFTYRGNRIVGNTFHRINNDFSGDDVSAVYLDDMVSGFNITGNAFVNVSRALLLGGGRDNVFDANTVDGTDHNAVHFDDRGLGWDAAACTPPGGEMIQFLARVPYTGALWAARYPTLATILAEQPCVPRGNVIVGNGYCRLSSPFIDTDNGTIASWNSTAWGNAPEASC